MVRYWFRFTGRVQGVGFRYRAVYTASSLGVTGWVYNEDDGSVTMEAQGHRFQIKELVELIGQGRFIEIEGIEKKEIPVVKHESSFEEKW